MGTVPRIMPETFETFEEAAKFVERWETGKKASNDEKLKMYGFYKQATVGNVNVDRPGMFSFEGKAKWDAWKAVEGMHPEEAKAKYVEELNRQISVYGD